MQSCMRVGAIHERLRAGDATRYLDLVEVRESRDDLSNCRQRFERSDAGHAHPGSEKQLPRVRRETEQ